jgi:hypothetical protein
MTRASPGLAAGAIALALALASPGVGNADSPAQPAKPAEAEQATKPPPVPPPHRSFAPIQRTTAVGILGTKA